MEICKKVYKMNIPPEIIDKLAEKPFALQDILQFADQKVESFMFYWTKEEYLDICKALGEYNVPAFNISNINHAYGEEYQYDDSKDHILPFVHLMNWKKNILFQLIQSNLNIATTLPFDASFIQLQLLKPFRNHYECLSNELKKLIFLYPDTLIKPFVLTSLNKVKQLMEEILNETPYGSWVALIAYRHLISPTIETYLRKQPVDFSYVEQFKQTDFEQSEKAVHFLINHCIHPLYHINFWDRMVDKLSNYIFEINNDLEICGIIELQNVTGYVKEITGILKN